MGKLTGFMMIVAGVGTAAYVYPMMSTGSDRAEKQLSDVVAITTAGTAAKTEPVLKKAPAPVATAPSGSTSTSVAGLVAGQAAVTTGTVAKPSPLTTTAEIAKPVEAPVPQIAKRPSQAKSDDEARATLSRDIQRELKRVGCFSGDVDGTWNSSTREAMRNFIDRVNATLPTDDPDHILKTLVQGHPGNACGKGCPSGQTASTDGKCLPTSIVAQPAKRPVPSATQQAAVQEPTVKRTPPAPSPAPVATATAPAIPTPPTPSAPATSAWETSVTTVAPPAMAAVAAAAALATSSSDSKSEAKRNDPIPGRMAVGAGTADTAQKPTIINEAQPKVSAEPKIVVKPKAKPENKPKPEQKADDEPKATVKVEPKPESKPDSNGASRPSIGAIAAVEREKEQRRASPPPVPTPRVAAYRPPPPPPRYVGAYSPPPVFRERQRFGPSIFKQIDQNGR